MLYDNRLVDIYYLETVTEFCLRKSKPKQKLEMWWMVEHQDWACKISQQHKLICIMLISIALEEWKKNHREMIWLTHIGNISLVMSLFQVFIVVTNPSKEGQLYFLPSFTHKKPSSSTFTSIKWFRKSQPQA